MTDQRATLEGGAAFLLPFAAGALGSVPTARAIPTWYRTLDKPSWDPPNVVFGPVWTLLYGLMGLALVLVRRSRRVEAGSPAGVQTAEAVFGLQLALNTAWSFAFFGARSTRGGLAVIALLWVSILATIAAFWRVRPVAAVLLLPYLGWVSFASLLNAEIARRN